MSGTIDFLEREVGELPLSVPTSVAFENLFQGPLKRDAIYINVRVLFRNMWGSVDPIKKLRISADTFASAIEEEMRFLHSFILEKSLGQVKPFFYHCGYNDLGRKLPHGIIRIAGTEKQKEYLNAEQKTMNLILAKSQQLGLLKFQTQISGQGHVILFTHSPIDLLFNNFYSVLLLESHTGTIKGPRDWYTKLTNGRSLPPMPFNKFTVQIFGDNNTYLAAMPVKIKQIILDMVEKDHWNAITSMDKIRMSINKLRDPYGKNYLLKVLRS